MVFERHLVHKHFAELQELTFGRVEERNYRSAKQNAGLRDAGDNRAEKRAHEGNLRD